MILYNLAVLYHGARVIRDSNNNNNNNTGEETGCVFCPYFYLSLSLSLSHSVALDIAAVRVYII